MGVIGASILIAVLVHRRSMKLNNAKMNKKRKRKERQAVTQLMFIAFSFLLGYLPLTSTKIFFMLTSSYIIIKYKIIFLISATYK